MSMDIGMDGSTPYYVSVVAVAFERVPELPTHFTNAMKEITELVWNLVGKQTKKIVWMDQVIFFAEAAEIFPGVLPVALRTLETAGIIKFWTQAGIDAAIGQKVSQLASLVREEHQRP
jgi:hypothetical protein